MADQILTQEELHRLFDYKDGHLYWKIKPSKCTSIGDKVGCLDTHNLYIKSSYKDKNYLVHRLVFACHYGYFPKMIDHINGIRFDNRIENLRVVSSTQNALNRSTAKGVYKHQNKFRARIKDIITHKEVHLGYFISEVEAHKCWQKAKIVYLERYLNKYKEDVRIYGGIYRIKNKIQEDLKNDKVTEWF